VISACRILLVPVIVALLAADTRASRVAAAAVFVAGAATDGLDGYLARRWNTSTRTGQWLDPLADKALVAAPIVTLVAQDAFPLWAAVLILGREVAIAALRVFLGSRGRSMPASLPAKVKTVLQIAAITLYVLPLGPWSGGLRFAALLAAVAFTMATGLQYVAAALGPADKTPKEAAR